jgi:hypothetical protein
MASVQGGVNWNRKTTMNFDRRKTALGALAAAALLAIFCLALRSGPEVSTATTAAPAKEAQQVPAPTDEEAPAPIGDADEHADGCVVAGLDELVEHAERIVIGRVVASEARWNDARTMVFTYHRLRIRHTIKGEESEEITIRVLGGQLPDEDFRVDATHQPRLSVGDEGVLFFDGDPGLWTTVVGSEQGFLPFARSESGLRCLVDGFGRPILGVSKDHRLVTGAPGATPPLGEQELVARIRALLS